MSNPEIIDRIAGTMVPVAMNANRAREKKTRAAELLRPIMRETDQEQGIWILSPDRKVLDHFVGTTSDVVQRTKQAIEKGLNAFGPVTPRKVEAVDTQPYLGQGVMPDGGICLAQYVRRRGDRSVYLSNAVLTGKEWKAFAPGAKAAPGTEWAVPDETARKIQRVTVAGPSSHWGIPPVASADARLTAKVDAVRDGLACLSYKGWVSTIPARQMETDPDPKARMVQLTGEGIYDMRTGKMRSLCIVGEGQGGGWDALIEWRDQDPEREKPGKQRPWEACEGCKGAKEAALEAAEAAEDESGITRCSVCKRHWKANFLGKDFCDPCMGCIMVKTKRKTDRCLNPDAKECGRSMNQEGERIVPDKERYR